MRIAISGAHATGKSTLVASLCASWPGYRAVEEAYHDQDERSLDLSVTGFEDQLAHSLELIRSSEGDDLVFDRSPLDYLAYLRAIDPAVDLGPWHSPIREAVASLRLVVFVPIEVPDQVHVPDDEYPGLRRRVDRQLRSLLLDDAWGLGLDALEVSGPVSTRVAQVTARCRQLG